MFEFRLRILDVREKETDPFSYLGIVEGFPEILVHAATIEQVERDLVNALSEHLERLMNREIARLDWDDYPTVKTSRLVVSGTPT
jgi:predicted RNase H-like HicB family nuclease